MALPGVPMRAALIGVPSRLLSPVRGRMCSGVWGVRGRPAAATCFRAAAATAAADSWLRNREASAARRTLGLSDSLSPSPRRPVAASAPVGTNSWSMNETPGGPGLSSDFSRFAPLMFGNHIGAGRPRPGRAPSGCRKRPDLFVLAYAQALAGLRSTRIAT